ncbi:hypothetical protein EYR41_011908 [Orbilia oligospora]|uniref:MACPF-like domain-containing protein n=1 Tax=Orbilia oligospora TaxID=2813651 RepID=A0A8H2DJ88_ORBOL|nr:hypothetical protein EYR41_011908 [Orbilia oligospora]
MASQQEASGVLPSQEQDEDKKLLLKVMRYDATLQEGEGVFVHEVGTRKLLKTSTLKDIRNAMLRYDGVKHLKNAKFCFKDGSTCLDDTNLGTYLTCLDEGGTIPLIPSVFLLKNRKFARASASKSDTESLGLKLDLDSSKNEMGLDKAKLPDRIKSSADSNNYTAASGSINHPMELSEHDWDIVIKNNNLLCGHQIIAQSTDTKHLATGIERSMRPAFILKTRVCDHDESAPAISNASSNGKGVHSRIPHFQVRDESYFEVHEAKNSFEKSLVKNSFSQTDAKVAVDGYTWGSAAVGFKSGSTTQDTNADGNEAEEMAVTYNFPRVFLELDNESLELSEACKADLDTIKCVKSLDAFHRKYGHFFATRIELGGRLCSSTKKTAVRGSNSHEKSDTLKIAAAASINVFGGGVSASLSHEQNSNERNANQNASMALAMTWEAKGGNTLLCNNPSQWCLTVADFRNWRIIQQSGMRPLLDVIADIPGHPNINAEFENLDDPSSKPPKRIVKNVNQMKFRLQSTRNDGYLTMDNFLNPQKDSHFLRMIDKIISNHNEQGFNSCQQLQRDHLNHEKSGSRVKMTKLEKLDDKLSVFTARYTHGAPVDELHHGVLYQLLDSHEKQILHGFGVPVESFASSEIYLKSCPVINSEPRTYIKFQTPGSAKKRGKIEAGDIVEMVGYKDGSGGILSKVAGKEKLGYQLLPWTPGNDVLNFKVVEERRTESPPIPTLSDINAFKPVRSTPRPLIQSYSRRNM